MNLTYFKNHEMERFELKEDQKIQITQNQLWVYHYEGSELKEDFNLNFDIFKDSFIIS